jgi:hypothetical protein
MIDTSTKIIKDKLSDITFYGKFYVYTPDAQVEALGPYAGQLTLEYTDNKFEVKQFISTDISTDFLWLVLADYCDPLQLGERLAKLGEAPLQNSLVSNVPSSVPSGVNRATNEEFKKLETIFRSPDISQLNSIGPETLLKTFREDAYLGCTNSIQSSLDFKWNNDESPEYKSNNIVDEYFNINKRGRPYYEYNKNDPLLGPSLNRPNYTSNNRNFEEQMNIQPVTNLWVEIKLAIENSSNLAKSALTSGGNFDRKLVSELEVIRNAQEYKTRIETERNIYLQAKADKEAEFQANIALFENQRTQRLQDERAIFEEKLNNYKRELDLKTSMDETTRQLDLAEFTKKLELEKENAAAIEEDKIERLRKSNEEERKQNYDDFLRKQIQIIETDREKLLLRESYDIERNEQKIRQQALDNAAELELFKQKIAIESAAKKLQSDELKRYDEELRAKRAEEFKQNQDLELQNSIIKLKDQQAQFETQLRMKRESIAQNAELEKQYNEILREQRLQDEKTAAERSMQDSIALEEYKQNLISNRTQADSKLQHERDREIIMLKKQTEMDIAANEERIKLDITAAELNSKLQTIAATTASQEEIEKAKQQNKIDFMLAQEASEKRINDMRVAAEQQIAQTQSTAQVETARILREEESKFKRDQEIERMIPEISRILHDFATNNATTIRKKRIEEMKTYLFFGIMFVLVLSTIYLQTSQKEELPPIEDMSNSSYFEQAKNMAYTTGETVASAASTGYSAVKTTAKVTKTVVTGIASARWYELGFMGLIALYPNIAFSFLTIICGILYSLFPTSAILDLTTPALNKYKTMSDEYTKNYIDPNTEDNREILKKVIGKNMFYLQSAMGVTNMTSDVIDKINAIVQLKPNGGGSKKNKKHKSKRMNQKSKHNKQPKKIKITKKMKAKYKKNKNTYKNKKTKGGNGNKVDQFLQLQVLNSILKIIEVFLDFENYPIYAGSDIVKITNHIFGEIQIPAEIVTKMKLTNFV